MKSPIKYEMDRLQRAVVAHETQRAIETQKLREISARCRQKTAVYYTAKREKTRATILAALRQCGRIGTVQLGKAAGMERSSLFKHLREMAEEGTVVRAGDRMKPEWEAAQ